MHKGTPNIGSPGAPPHCGGGVANPKQYALPHMCYPAEFGRSRSNGTSVIK